MNSSAKGNAERACLAARLADGPHVSAPAESRTAFWATGFPNSRRRSRLRSTTLPEHFRSPRPSCSASRKARPICSIWCAPMPARLIRLLDVRAGSASRRADREDHAATCSRGRREADVMHLLRRMKAEAALLIALCDIGGVWPVMRVTAALTELAVASVQAALRFLLRQEATRGRHVAARHRPARGRQRPGRARDGQDGRGRTELFQRHRPDRVFRSRRASLVADIEPQPFFVRVTQALARLLQQRTGDGYVFRVDLRLRPDPPRRRSRSRPRRRCIITSGKGGPGNAPP